MSAPWQWLSFADSSRPKGTQFLGVAIVRARDPMEAAMVATLTGCNPGGEIVMAEIPEHLGPPPDEWDHKLITDRATIDRLTQEWHGSGTQTLGELKAKEAS